VANSEHVVGKELEGKVALVTGSSRGIGRAIAKGLAEQGCYVFINYTSRPEAAGQALELCKKCGGDGETLQFSVADSLAVESAFDQIKERKGKIDILVNNAGVTSDGLLMRFKDEDWHRTFATNLDGAFFCTRAASKMMLRAKSGRIINISSVVAEMGNAGQAAYVSSKAGLIGLTKSVARELASRNITVNAVAPGFISTEMTDVLSDQIKEEHFKQIPLGRYGSVEEVSDLVVFLASSKASYITGQVFAINGGMYM
jgi:3-oxoacyl-[acyl-carrier protein] reductase